MKYEVEKPTLSRIMEFTSVNSNRTPEVTEDRKKEGIERGFLCKVCAISEPLIEG